MNTESDAQAPDSSGSASVEKKPLVSIPFLVIVIGLGVAGYFCGPWVMTQFMYWKGENRAAESSENGATVEGDESYGGEGEGGYGGEGGGGRGGRGGGGGGGGRGGRGDPEAFWARIDADGNGKVEGEEISDRMAERVGEIDTDGDGAISKEEFLAGMANRGGGRGGRGGGGGRPQRPGSDADDASEEDPNDAGQTP